MHYATKDTEASTSFHINGKSGTEKMFR
jgi:hypothetical protein